MGKWCLHASSFIFDRIIIKVAGNQDRHKSSDEFDFGPLLSMAHLYVFWNETWPWHIGLRWAIVALWATFYLLPYFTCANSEGTGRLCDKNHNGPRQANLVLIAYASSEGSGEPAHPGSLASTFASRSYKQWIKRNLQTESQIPGPSEWLGMRS